MAALIRAEEVLPEAQRILARERARLRSARVPGELVLEGGSSVPGALTRGDVDLHLRVDPADFPHAVEALRTMLVVVHAEIWAPSLATFEVPGDVPTGLAVTPSGSEHDLRFTRSWQLLAADADLLTAYNQAKSAADDEDYEDRKSAFFDHLLRLWPDHPAGGGSGR